MNIKKSISFKVILILISTIIVVMSVMSFYSFYTQKNRAEANLKRNAAQTAEELSYSLIYPFWNVIDKEIRKTINLAMEDENVYAVIVNDYDGKFYMGSKKNDNGETVDIDPEIYNRAEFENKFLNLEKRVIKENEVIGFVEVIITDKYLNDFLKRLVLRLLLQTAVLSIIIIFAVFISLNYLILSPLIVLEHAVEKVKEKDFSVRADIKSSDEIGRLANTFNLMLVQLETSFDKIEQQFKEIKKSSQEKEKLLQELKVKNERLQNEILAHQKDEEELKNTRNFLDRLFNSLPSVLISVDTEGTITNWNKAAVKMTQIPLGKAVSRKIWDTVPFLSKYKDHLFSVLQFNEPVELEKETISAGEKKYYFNISIYPIEYVNVEGAVLRIDDVTDAVVKDQQLRQAQKMETVGTLAGGLAHDFNNVLGGIMGTVSLLEFGLQKEGGLDRKKLKEDLRTVERAAERAADMVKQLLTLSRKQELSFAPVDLNLSIKHVVKICMNTFDKSINIIPKYRPEPTLIEADPTQIEQVLLNLCVNASHAMTIMRKNGEPQGGTLTIAVEKFDSDIHFCESHPEAEETDYWLLRVSDTGVGMDQKSISKIFDPFYTTKKMGVGTGLGLAMVYNIINQHNGFVDVYSELGIGSTFNVFLPILKKGETALSSSEKEQTIPSTSGTILVVDDEAVMREIAKRILEECGYSILLAKDGQEGVDIFRERHTELKGVLLDMAMPRKSGKEAFVEMREIDDSVKIVLSSGFKQDRRVQETFEMGADGFIEKPYSLHKLAFEFTRYVED